MKRELQPPEPQGASSLFREVEREKQASRDADARELAAGRKSVEQLERENGVLPGSRFRVDFEGAKRLW